MSFSDGVEFPFESQQPKRYGNWADFFAFGGSFIVSEVLSPAALKNEALTESVKKELSYSYTRTCAYQGVRNVCFSEILACFAFLKHPF